MATDDQRRNLLQRLAYGDAEDVRPSDRLRALELLRELDTGRPPGLLALVEELVGMDGETLQGEVDAIMARTLAVALEPREAGNWPQTRMVLDREVEIQVMQRTDGWRSLEQCEQDVAEGVGVAEVTQPPPMYEPRRLPDPPGDDASDAPVRSPLAPPGLDPEDVERGWHHGRPRRR